MLEVILVWVRANYLEVISVVLSAIVGLLLYKKGKQEWLRKIILALVTEAEKKFGSGTGELKYAIVVERLYEVLPWIVRVLYTKQQIDRMIEDAVEYLKRYLAEGKNLLGYGE